MITKNKLYLFQRLRSNRHAAADFELLKTKAPGHKNIDKFSRNPQRYAFDILYDLLDVATEEEVLLNRQPKEDGSSKTLTEPKAKTEKKPSSKTSKKKDKSKANSNNKKNPEDGSSKALTDEDGSIEDKTEEPSSEDISKKK